MPTLLSAELIRYSFEWQNCFKQLSVMAVEEKRLTFSLISVTVHHHIQAKLQKFCVSVLPDFLC